MKSVLKYFFYIFIIGFAITAIAQNKYNFSKKFTTEEKQEINQVSSSLANQYPSSTAEETSGPCPVGEPSNPDPAFGAIDVPLSYPNLSWINGSGATSIEVIFDGATIYTGAPVTSLPMPPLNYYTTYS